MLSYNTVVFNVTELVFPLVQHFDFGCADRSVNGNYNCPDEVPCDKWRNVNPVVMPIVEFIRFP